MTGSFIVLGFLMLSFLAIAFSVEPECPQLKCMADNKVACFIDEERCNCRCVSDSDPCASLLNHPCPEAHTLSCTSEAITCKCRCVLK
ncbi:uncharacterized protein LOC125946742 [Dermacentor silvarum]|uniref:uncharacterized protein LOC125946742 n=1 Tax=Dermacentor silvarum TaxID=543639 RepID=UPI002100F111|nr:uncharacterized protein LOC125946742 [Dermacentor silvarum]XP_049526598.1 uncharacterized protein LOC125946742 [Dermacentor silvarum]